MWREGLRAGAFTHSLRAGIVSPCHLFRDNQVLVCAFLFLVGVFFLLVSLVLVFPVSSSEMLKYVILPSQHWSKKNLAAPRFDICSTALSAFWNIPNSCQRFFSFVLVRCTIRNGLTYEPIRLQFVFLCFKLRGLFCRGLFCLINFLRPKLSSVAWIILQKGRLQSWHGYHLILSF